MEDDRMRGCADDETTMTTPLHCISGEEGNGHRRARGCSRQKRVSHRRGPWRLAARRCHCSLPRVQWRWHYYLCLSSDTTQPRRTRLKLMQNRRRSYTQLSSRLAELVDDSKEGGCIIRFHSTPLTATWNSCASQLDTGNGHENHHLPTTIKKSTISVEKMKQKD